MRGVAWRNVSCILVTVLTISAWVTTGIPGTKRPFALFSIVKVWKVSAALLAVSLLLFISAPLSVLAATQELTRLGRLRLYPLKGKFLMRLQKPPPLCIYSLRSPFLLVSFLLSFSPCLPRLSFPSSHFSLVVVGLLPQTGLPGVLPFSSYRPSIPPFRLPPPAPVPRSPTSIWPLSMYIFQAGSQTWAQAADGVYNEPPSRFHMPWN